MSAGNKQAHVYVKYMDKINIATHHRTYITYTHIMEKQLVYIKQNNVH